MGPTNSAPGWRYFLIGVYQPPPTTDDDGNTEPTPAWPYTRWLMSKNPEEVLKAVQEMVAAIDTAHVSIIDWIIDVFSVSLSVLVRGRGATSFASEGVICSIADVG